MCLPPNNDNSSIYFSKMEKLSKNINLENLSMGMSQDYIEAIKYKSTYLEPDEGFECCSAGLSNLELEGFGLGIFELESCEIKISS